MNARHEDFLRDLLTVGGAGEAYSVQLVRRDGYHLGGCSRETLADLLEKHFPGAGRKPKTRAGQRRRTTERKK